MEKRCSRCQIAKPLGDFHRNKHQADGYQVWCKACVRGYQNQKREDNREAYRSYQQEWFRSHPDYFRRYTRKPKMPTGPIVVFDDD